MLIGHPAVAVVILAVWLALATVFGLLIGAAFRFGDQPGRVSR